LGKFWGKRGKYAQFGEKEGEKTFDMVKISNFPYFQLKI